MIYQLEKVYPTLKKKYQFKLTEIYLSKTYLSNVG